MAVLPYGKSGVIGGAMLGLGRALGETLAVAIVLSASGGITLQPDLQQQPVDDRGEHRAAVPRVDRPGRQHPDRQRPGAVRHHARRQHARPLDRQPAGRLLRSELMTTDTRPAAPDRAPSSTARSSATAGCRASRPPACSSPARAVGVALLRAHRLQRRPGRRLRRRPRHARGVRRRPAPVEGRRKATRPARDLRGRRRAFGVAMVPLVSLVWTVLSHGPDAAGRRVLHLLDARRRRRGRRRVPRDPRHADHHRRSPR